MKRFWKMITGYIRQTDIWLWLICLGLSGFSAVLILGIGETGLIPGVGMRTVMVQAGASGLGVIAALLLSKFDYHTLTKLWKLHMPLAYIFVGLTFFIGQGTAERLGDKSWIAVPGTTMTIQPTEFLKISFILTLAYHLFHIKDEINRPHQLLGVAVHGAIPILLIHFQGDDGTALVFAGIFLGMVFAAGISWLYIIPVLGVGVIAAPLAWFFVMSPHQKERILALYDPNPDPLGIMYQQYNAQLAIGSGKIWGKGIFAENHRYVPEMHNDFIFSFIGESLGFVGCLAVVAVFAALCIRLMVVGHRAEDFQGTLICVGVCSLICAQTVINIGMCLSLLPVIGITLPFISSGGSSVLAGYMAIGLALSVAMRNPKTLFAK